MRRITLLFVFIVCFAGIFTAVAIRKVDAGFILVVGKHVIDPVGGIKLAITRKTRNCSNITDRLANPDATKAIEGALDGPTAEEKSIIRAAWFSGTWALVESDFVNREPAIFLLQADRANTYAVVTVYGGTAAPFNDTQAIHEYFLGAAPSVPAALINCYEPVGAPFNRASW